MTSKTIAAALGITGVVLVITGVALFSFRAALIVAGALAISALWAEV